MVIYSIALLILLILGMLSNGELFILLVALMPLFGRIFGWW